MSIRESLIIILKITSSVLGSITDRVTLVIKLFIMVIRSLIHTELDGISLLMKS